MLPVQPNILETLDDLLAASEALRQLFHAQHGADAAHAFSGRSRWAADVHAGITTRHSRNS